ncbi:MAG TPA: hypothetical protein DD435_14220, partial [Cyanobacteria bacterium UBA8530]|nr:hypothetical protein [Cyanobacteria bacterium UBA8530]
MKESESKRIVLVAGAKGGIGRSVVACNLAVAFARKRPTALLDLDWLSGGSQASYLDLDPSRDWGECLESPSMLPSCMIEHASKVKLLAAPPPGFPPPRPRQLAKLIGEISRHFSFLVIDTSYPFIDERMEVLIDFASPVLLVVTPDITTLQSTKVFLESARRLNYPQDRFQIVFNRAGITEDLDASDLSGSLERPIIGQIPHHPSVVTSLNRGLPIVHHLPNSSIAGAFLNLAAKAAANPSSPVAQVLAQILSKPEEKKIDSEKKEKKESENPVRTIEAKMDEASSVTALAVSQSVALSAEQAIARKAIHGELIEELKRLDIHIPKFTTPEEHQNLRNQIAEVVAHILDEMEGINLRSRAERTKLVADITDEAIGYGPLERFLADPLVTEIMVNGPDSIYVEQKGKITLTNQSFTNEAQLRVVIDRIVAPLGRRVDESSPMCDA